MKHSTESGLTSVEGTALNIYLEKMIAEKWVKKFPSPHSKQVMVYTLDEKGLELAKTISELIKRDDPLLKLPVFFDVKLLGSAYD